MIKTLHITAFLAFLLALGVIFSPILFEGSSDPQIEEFLDSPGVVERFKENYSGRSRSDEDETPPLVKEARDFALYLDPPEPEPREEPERRERPERERPEEPEQPEPQRVTANFSVAATSYSPNNPEQSRALIDLPGSGMRWVRQGQRLEHLMIEEIGDGVVYAKDRSGELQEVSMDQAEKDIAGVEVYQAGQTPERERSSRFLEMEVRPGDEDEPFETVADAASEEADQTEPDEQERPTRRPRRETASSRQRTTEATEEPETERPARREPPEVPDEVAQKQAQVMEDFVETMRSKDEDQDEESREEMMGRLIERLRAARVDDEEAEDLDELGKELERNDGR